MAKFDLTPKICQYLDRHLVFPLLEFLTAKGLYDKNELLQNKLDILNKTNMVDYAIDIHQYLYEHKPIPETLKQRRVQVVTALQELNNSVTVVLSLLSNDAVMKQMESVRDQKTLCTYLTKEFDFKIDMMESMYKLAKFRYECGNYSITTSYLYFYLLVMPTSDKHYLAVLWGKLASEILVQNWDLALEDLNKLREYIDGGSANFASPLHLLQQRTWLIHWSLFVFFNHVKGRDLIIDMFLNRPHYLNAIQTMCPHILRYLACAVIINRSKRNALKDLVKVIQQEFTTYKDPITEFLEHLYVSFDFESAREKLTECTEVLDNDFFLVACLDEFVENARLMIFETFCRIHQCISIQMLASKLNMGTDEAECWIVNLIRNARLDAKIDSKLGHVIMGTQPLSPYQQLLEKIDSLSVRSEALQALIERKVKVKQNSSNTGGENSWANKDF
ncbi:hypothetical protein WDU94_006545 [Cyamophila willieti]